MDDHYLAAPDRYQRQPYRSAGRHGLRLPGIGLGLWHNFGAECDPTTAKAMVKYCSAWISSSISRLNRSATASGGRRT